MLYPFPIPNAVPLRRVFHMPLRRQQSSSKSWLQRHVNDKYVKQAVQQDLRSRGAFKLLQIQGMERMITPNAIVVDLGSAPGGWSIAARRIMDAGTKPSSALPEKDEAGAARTEPKVDAGGGHHSGTIVAVDILPMEAITGVTFLQGDFTSADVQDKIRAVVNQAATSTCRSSSGNRRPLVLLSDMLHNTTGQGDLDHLRSMDLLRSVLDFVPALLSAAPSSGTSRPVTLLAKYYRGRDEKEVVDEFRDVFAVVKLIKPEASRKGSREMYVYSSQYRGK